MSLLTGKLPLTRRQSIALFLSVSAVAGAILLLMFLSQPSEPGNQLIFGLSPVRVLIGVVFAGLLMVNIGGTLLLAFDLWPGQKSFEGTIIKLFGAHQTGIILGLYILFVLTGTILLLSIPPIIRPLAFLEPLSGRLGGFLGWLFLATLLVIVMLRFVSADILLKNGAIARLDKILITWGLLLIVFVLYAQIAALIGWVNKIRYSYWNLLAAEFLQGKLYLEKPPTTHDLILYAGKWYIPMPPLPAILMMPLVYLFGAEGISTSYLSMLFSAINGVLLFSILQRMAGRQWIQLSKIGALCLVAVFLFGTPHLWVGISGRAWFISQILTVLFLALATYAALRSWSPWVVGSSIAAAILARPNSLMTWPFVFAIAMQILKEDQGQVSLKQASFWTVKSALPILIAIGAALLYNYLRFDNFLDFGYTRLNGDPQIVQDAQTYGVFSSHFILRNLDAMLFRLPEIHWGGQWPIEPSTTGMSIFLTTPPLFYLFHRYQKQWWIMGAWLAVLLNLILLLCYHNTGAHQFGYRYILDMLVPLMALLATGIGRKIPWQFIFLFLASIVINIYGANWFMNG